MQKIEKSNQPIMKWLLMVTILVLGISLISACAQKPLEADSTSIAMAVNNANSNSNGAAPTADLCTAENKLIETKRLNRYMVTFDDLSVLAQATPREQLAVVILEMQKVRRDAAFEEVQPCFSNLQITQVNFMNGVVNTMTSFLSGIEADTLTELITETRNQRTLYDTELASLLGMTYVTLTPAPTIEAPAETPTFTPAPIRALAAQDGYILDGPGTQFMAIETFLIGQEANIIAKSADGQWLKISRGVPTEVTGWIAIQGISIEGDINQVPVE
jgi:hypothetical protein